jgi:hypothetical protein
MLWSISPGREKSMSFDLYLIGFADQQSHGIPRLPVLEAFGSGVRWEDDATGLTRYSRMDGCTVSLSALKDDTSLISCVSVNRPVSDKRLWGSLYKVMQLGNVALFFPGCNGPLIANVSVAAHLPKFEALGQPILVNSGSEIVEQIEST